MFIKTIHKSGIQTFGLLLVIAGAGAALLAWPGAVATGVSRGLSICSSVIIPSLFPFLVLAGFLVRSGVSQSLGRRLEKPTRKLFGLPGCCAAGILVGFIGGYPAGGVAVGQLVSQGDITPRQGRRMLRFCVNAGPAFVISAVGAGMLGSVRYGAVLFAAHIAASLLMGIGQRVWMGRHPVVDRVPMEARAAGSPSAGFDSVCGIGQRRLPLAAVHVRLRGAVRRPALPVRRQRPGGLLSACDHPTADMGGGGHRGNPQSAGRHSGGELRLRGGRRIRRGRALSAGLYYGLGRPVRSLASWPPPCTSTSCSIGTSSSPGCFTACWQAGCPCCCSGSSPCRWMCSTPCRTRASPPSPPRQPRRWPCC